MAHNHQASVFLELNKVPSASANHLVALRLPVKHVLMKLYEINKIALNCLAYLHPKVTTCYPGLHDA